MKVLASPAGPSCKRSFICRIIQWLFTVLLPALPAGKRKPQNNRENTNGPKCHSEVWLLELAAKAVSSPHGTGECSLSVGRQQFSPKGGAQKARIQLKTSCLWGIQPLQRRASAPGHRSLVGPLECDVGCALLMAGRYLLLSHLAHTSLVPRMAPKTCTLSFISSSTP